MASHCKNQGCTQVAVRHANADIRIQQRCFLFRTERASQYLVDGTKPWTGDLLNLELEGGLEQFERHHLQRIVTHHIRAGTLQSTR